MYMYNKHQIFQHWQLVQETSAPTMILHVNCSVSDPGYVNYIYHIHNKDQDTQDQLSKANSKALSFKENAALGEIQIHTFSFLGWVLHHVYNYTCVYNNIYNQTSKAPVVIYIVYTPLRR